eukprot:m.1420615 g.1420615  ORF g.1420615 m.1420615 type:complete len:323 (-) comp25045_c1_seq45:3621-4589(-)
MMNHDDSVRPPPYETAPQSTDVNEWVNISQPSEQYYVEVYENQRWYPFKGWTHALLPTDRHRWSDENGKAGEEPTGTALPPPGCVWSCSGKGPANGTPWQCFDWEYALDFPRTYYPARQATHCVRRRVWRRGVRIVDAPRLAHDCGVPVEDVKKGCVQTPPTVKFSGAVCATWVDDAAPCATSFVIIEDGKLFLLARAGDAQAQKVVPMKEIKGTTNVHRLESGCDHAFDVQLCGSAMQTIRLVAANADEKQRLQDAVNKGARAARPSGAAERLRSLGRDAASLASKGGKLATGAFAAAFGWEAGSVVGRHVGWRICKHLGL